MADRVRSCLCGHRGRRRRRYAQRWRHRSTHRRTRPVAESETNIRDKHPATSTANARSRGGHHARGPMAHWPSIRRRSPPCR
jgi:hypothetical protein